MKEICFILVQRKKGGKLKNAMLEKNKTKINGTDKNRISRLQSAKEKKNHQSNPLPKKEKVLKH